MICNGLLFVLIVVCILFTTSGKPSRRTACSRSEWRCDNGRCVPSSNKCDGQDQCGDNSDEQSGCFDLSGACGSGRICRSILKCVSRNQLCDGVNNCGDMSDEEGCSGPKLECPTGQPVRDVHGQPVHCGPSTDQTIHTCPGNSDCFVDPANRFAICCPP